MSQGLTLFWFRRDLRLDDNNGLRAALMQGSPVQGIFVFDRNILDRLEDRDDARVTYLHRAVCNLDQALRERGSSLRVYYGKPLELWPQILEDFPATSVLWNRDYEPYARSRDEAVATFLKNKGIVVRTASDHCLLEPGRVLKSDGTPYTVFSPFARCWRQTLTKNDLQPASPDREDWTHLNPAGPLQAPALPTLTDMGFTTGRMAWPAPHLDKDLISRYAQQRDFPGVAGTSRLGLHLRFGTVSIRAVASQAMNLSDTFVNELIWRDFYQSILWYFPHTTDRSFKPAYDQIQWRNQPEEFERWCRGETGYPLVDAGMRELLQTGWMHNRVRMVVASFLTKHLLIDWRWGEAWFARHLLDFELASNVGGWQWAAGCGNDAAPYFRVFNPYEQTRKFDPKGLYIRRWVPELDEPTYPAPVVEHAYARQRALDTYKSALASAT